MLRIGGEQIVCSFFCVSACMNLFDLVDSVILFDLQMRVRDGDINPGDVFLANHPLAGGSHLPDLTVITPVFWK